MYYISQARESQLRGVSRENFGLESIHKLNKLARTATLLAQVSSSLFTFPSVTRNSNDKAVLDDTDRKKNTITNLLLKKRYQKCRQCLELVFLLLMAVVSGKKLLHFVREVHDGKGRTCKGFRKGK